MAWLASALGGAAGSAATGAAAAGTAAAEGAATGAAGGAASGALGGAAPMLAQAGGPAGSVLSDLPELGSQADLVTQIVGRGQPGFFGTEFGKEMGKLGSAARDFGNSFTEVAKNPGNGEAWGNMIGRGIKLRSMLSGGNTGITGGRSKSQNVMFNLPDNQQPNQLPSNTLASVASTPMANQGRAIQLTGMGLQPRALNTNQLMAAIQNQIRSGQLRA